MGARRLRRRDVAATDERAPVIGIARVGPRTKDLAKRVQRGEVAIINHQDLDRVAAESLVEAGVVAVVNAAESISGRYPNSGPSRIVAAGVPLLDEVGPGVMDAVHDGDVVELRDGALWRGDEKLAVGTPLHGDDIEQRMEAAREGVGEELRRFAKNTLTYIDDEAAITFEPLTVPPLRTKIRGRHALVVVRGHDYKHDLAALRPYIRQFRPVLIAVDGGADALLEVGLTPDIITGDFDSLSEAAMQCGAELVHHVHPDGRAPGRETLVASNLKYQEFVAEGMSEDAAMLMAYEAGASLIVAVGSHTTMVEFLDKGRRGMASTFLTRLRLGPVLVDAKGVNRLYESRVRRRDLLLLIASALLVVVVLAIVSDPFRVFLHGFQLVFSDFWQTVRGWL
ncbi:MAG TPA: putative cytokinetic ring protein SteA [Acidimicrobiia bacterium]|nr:putative cytokinetic ring protein SteA [Acidimicrobiia bacterium]